MADFTKSVLKAKKEPGAVVRFPAHSCGFVPLKVKNLRVKFMKQKFPG